MPAKFHTSEAQSLPIHVGKCEERYHTLFNRLDRIEKILLGVAAGVFTMLLSGAGVILTAAVSKSLGL